MVFNPFMFLTQFSQIAGKYVADLLMDMGSVIFDKIAEFQSLADISSVI